MASKKRKGPSGGDAGAPKKLTDDGSNRDLSRNSHRRLGGSFHAEEARIVAALRAAGWIVWDYEDAATHDEAAHFFGSGDLIQPRHSTAVRALRRAVRGEPIPRPTAPEWWWVDITEGDFRILFSQRNAGCDAGRVHRPRRGFCHRADRQQNAATRRRLGPLP